MHLRTSLLLAAAAKQKEEEAERRRPSRNLIKETSSLSRPSSSSPPPARGFSPSRTRKALRCINRLCRLRSSKRRSDDRKERKKEATLSETGGKTAKEKKEICFSSNANLKIETRDDVREGEKKINHQTGKTGGGGGEERRRKIC
jgi:hypothetical protein